MKTILQVLLVLGVSAQNPLSKCIQLLGELQQKVLKEGEQEQKQFESFADWCKDEAVSTQYEIKDGKASIESFNAVIEKESATIDSQENQIGEIAQRVAMNNKDLQAATEIRAKEAADFSASDADLAQTVDMLGRAIGIIDKNMRGSSFVQNGAAKQLIDTLNVVLQASAFQEKDKAALTALVQQAQDDDFSFAQGAPDPAAYKSQSGGILDTLEDMKDKAAAMRNDAQKAEMNTKHSFEMLEQSLKTSIAQDEKDMSGSKAAKSAAEEAKAKAEGDLAAAEKGLTNDEKYLSDISSDCQTKAADWEVSQKSRADELEALGAAKKLIEEKTGGGADRAYGLIQVKASADSTGIVGTKIVSMLKNLETQSQDVNLAQLALRVKAAVQMDAGADPFVKVKGMISEMIEKLIKDAAEEASHKAFCDKEMGESRAKIDDHNTKIDKYSTRKDKATAAIAKLTQEVATLTDELATMAKLNAELGKMRSEEKASFAVAKKDYEDGIEGLSMALQILRDYYAEKSDGESLLQQPPTSTHAKSADSASGFIGLLEVAQSDFSKLLADATVAEESAQSEYDRITQENAVSKAIKEASIKGKTSEKANLEKQVSDLTGDLEGEQAELDAVLEYFDKLKPACIAKPEPYAERKRRREAEIEGLKQAMSILEGESAPAAFLALRSVRRHIK